MFLAFDLRQSGKADPTTRQYERSTTPHHTRQHDSVTAVAQESVPETSSMLAIPSPTNSRLPNPSLAGFEDATQIVRLDSSGSERLSPASSSQPTPQRSTPRTLSSSHDDPTDLLSWSNSSASPPATPPCGSSPLVARIQSSHPSDWLRQCNEPLSGWGQSWYRGSMHSADNLSANLSNLLPTGSGVPGHPRARGEATTGGSPVLLRNEAQFDTQAVAKTCNGGSWSPIMGGPALSRKRKRSETDKTLMEQRPRCREFRDSQGVLLGITGVYGARQNTRGKLNPEQKASKALQGPSCNYCKHLKRKCSFSFGAYRCDRCILTNSVNLHIPCINPGIVDAVLFRGGPPENISDHPLRFADHIDRVWGISTVSSQLDRRVIELTQDFGASVEVQVARFVPCPGDKTAYIWTAENGEVMSLEMPPYCISNTTAVEEQLAAYIRRSAIMNLEKHVDYEWSDQIVCSTFQMALRLVDTSTLIHQTLILWSSTRLIEETWRICGEETLGMAPIQGNIPWAGIIPVPPMIDQQLDQIVIRKALKPQGDWILKRLNVRFQDAGKNKTVKNWLEIFLTSFLLLHNCAIQLQAERAFARRYGMSGRYGPRGHYKDAEDQFNTARVILVYFHTVLRGASLFNAPVDSREEAGIDREQWEYLENLKTWAASRENNLVGLRRDNQYENGLYFAHQLLFDGYDARPANIEELAEENG